MRYYGNRACVETNITSALSWALLSMARGPITYHDGQASRGHDIAPPLREGRKGAAAWQFGRIVRVSFVQL